MNAADMRPEILETISQPRLAPTAAPQIPLLRFVHISDTHISHDPGYNLPEARFSPAEGARQLVERLNRLPFTPDFILHTGDVAYDPHPEAYQTARDIFAQLKWPIYYLAGNHDDAAALQSAMIGKPGKADTPFDHTFDMNGVQFVCIDSNGPAAKPAGRLLPKQLEWLDGILSSSDPRPLVVAVHHNVLPTGIPWWDGFMRLQNGEELHELLLKARHRLRGVFHGHVHQAVDQYRDGILYSGVVSSWYQLHSWPGQSDTLGDDDTVPGFNVVTVYPQQTFIRRCAMTR